MINIALIGFMGTGKTTVGRKLAVVLGLEFMDTDDEIVRITGMEIPRIFKKYGPIRFRSEETLALKRLLRQTGQVISTGGGIVLREENVRLLQENTFVVALSASPEAVFERVGHLKNRPLLNCSDPRARIEALLEERAGKYDFAHLTVDTSTLSTGQVTDTIARAYRDYCQQNRRQPSDRV
ncbi:MAG TPA: shikimate kinase [Bacillota bacterium]|nr:shikimate kinase [Bacillota bacterium]